MREKSPSRPRSDVVPYLAAADLLVHPTFYDSCSLVVLEALASGCRRRSRAAGADELMTTAAKGSEFPTRARPRPWRPHRALLDPRERSRMGAAARELALRHSFERNATGSKGSIAKSPAAPACRSRGEQVRPSLSRL